MKKKRKAFEPSEKKMHINQSIIDNEQCKQVIGDINKRYYIPITKTNEEQQTITGVVLRPEIIDAQGDIISKEVIAKSAYKFLANYNETTKLGLMHQDFNQKFELYESYIAPQDITINKNIVKKDSWVITVHILDEIVWKQVKKRELTGFSIGGFAKAINLQEQKLGE